MKVTLEKKISFVVAGREFDDLKTAQFFQRAIRLHKLETESPEACAAFLIDHWNGLLFGGKNPMGFTTQQVVELVHNLQTPKVALSSPKPTPKKKRTCKFWLVIRRPKNSVMHSTQPLPSCPSPTRN